MASSDKGQKLLVEIDGPDYEWDQDTISVTQIQGLGNISANVPDIEVDPDNNEITLPNFE